MIAILCAMDKEKDAILKLIKNVKIKHGRKINYHDHLLDVDYYEGKLGGKDVVLTRCGVGEVYATISTIEILKRYKPELVINLGVAGSLSKDIHVNDVIVADRVAHWRIDVPDWPRNINSDKCSYECDKKAIDIVKNMRKKNLYVGNIVSADEFIYKKSQLNTIKKYFPNALAGEMEGAAIANTCFAYNTKIIVIRSISDEAHLDDNYKHVELHLDKVCKTSAELCAKLIERY